MAIFDNPTTNFFNAFTSATESGRVFNETLRKNLAYNALRKTYGDEIGDIDLATKAEALAFDKANNPLLLEGNQLINDGRMLANADQANQNDFNITDRQQRLRTNEMTLDSTEEATERARRLQQAQDVARTLKGALSSLATDMEGVEDPQQRAALFDQSVTRLAPLLGADAAALQGELAEYRERVATEGVAALPIIQQELDAALTAAMDPADAVRLQTAQIGLDKAKVGLEQEREKAKNGGLSAKDLEKKRQAASEATNAIAQAEAEAAEMARRVAAAKAFIDENPAATGFLATDIFGVGQQTFGDTPAAQLQAQLDTIETNVAFTSLRDLKAGGATLGPVSNAEQEMLKASKGSLKKAQGAEQLKGNLDAVLRAQQGTLERLKRAYEADYGDLVDTDDETLPVDDSELWGPAERDNPLAPPTVGDAAQQVQPGGTLSNGLTWSLEP